jgi:hypothetical protein
VLIFSSALILGNFGILGYFIAQILGAKTEGWIKASSENNRHVAPANAPPSVPDFAFRRIEIGQSYYWPFLADSLIS